MANKKFSESVKDFHEKFQHLYTYHRYHQKRTREEADRTLKAGNVKESSVCSAVSDELANVVAHVKTLLDDFENLITTGVIK